jgi:hypothetical protein
MKELQKDWITSGLIDFEYKKYILLAYLKNVRENFDQQILYPFLSDLIFHYRNLLSIKDNKKLLYENFPGVISKPDFEKLKVNYQKIVQDDEVMAEIEDILEFSISKCKETINAGKDIYEYVEENVEISTIGLSPLYAKEGYLMISERAKHDMKIFRFQISVFENADEKYQGLHTEFIDSVYKSITHTYEQVKLSLIRKYQDLPNPATYLVSVKINLPFYETLFPVAKRLLVKHINSSS